MENFFILLIALNFCHLLADYSHLSRPWMLSAKKIGKPLTPILAHAGVHAVLMTIAIRSIGWVSPSLLVNLFLIQLFTHFAIDVLKGKLNVLIPSLTNPINVWHWIIFGLDQFLHQCVIIGMVFYVYKESIFNTDDVILNIYK